MIQDSPEIKNMNPSLNQNNQFISQVHDPGLPDLAQKVKQLSQEKEIIEEKKEEEEEEKKEEEKKGSRMGGISSSMIQRRMHIKKLDEEFRNLFNKENSNINDIRRCLIHFIILVGVINCCAWEIDCLFYNICYGENIEMKRWISALLFPLIILSIFLLYILYMSINYLQKKIIVICIIIYLILSLFLIGLGIGSIVAGVKKSISQDDFNNLTKLEKEYYNNGKDKLESEYRKKMMLSGIINIILGACGVIVFFLTLFFSSLLSKTGFDWRPPLRSHVRPQRMRKVLQLYTQNYDSFLNLFRAENPTYQLDPNEAQKNKERFNEFKSINLGKSLGRGINSSIQKEKKESENESEIFKKKKKNLDKSEKSNDEEELPLPTIKKKKKVLLSRIVDDKNDKEEENNKSDEEKNKNNNHIDNHIDNHVNNNVNNHNNIQIEEINTDIKDNNKEEI